MNKIVHFFKTVKFWFVLNLFRLSTKIVKTICSIIFPKCLVVLRKECACEVGDTFHVF